MRRITLIALVAVAALAVACESAPAANCEPVSLAVERHITSALIVYGDGYIRGARAVRIEEGLDSWYVAADIQAPGLEGRDNIAVWVVGSLSKPGLLFSADGMAYEFSGMGYHGGGDNTWLPEYDKKVRAAERCTEAALK